MPFGAVLAQTGGLGRFQALQVALLAVPILLMAAHNLLQNFSAAVPPHRCRVPAVGPRGGGGAAVAPGGASVAPGGTSSMAAGGASVASGDTLVASGGTLVASDGASMASGGTSVASGGTLVASGGTSVASGGSLVASGGISRASGGTLMASGGTPRDSGGISKASDGASMASGGTLMDSGGTSVASGGTSMAPGRPLVTSGGTLVASSGIPRASGGTLVASGGSLVASGGTLMASDGTSMASGGTLVASGDASVASGGTLVASGGTSMDSGGTLRASGGTLMASSGTSVASGGTLMNSGGSSMASGGISKASGGTLMNSGGTSVASGGSSTPATPTPPAVTPLPPIVSASPSGTRLPPDATPGWPNGTTDVTPWWPNGTADVTLGSCRRLVTSASPNGSGVGAGDTEPCHDGWEYDTSVYVATIVTEWDLVCGARQLRQMAQSIYMAGVLVGALLLGGLSDKFGRKALLLWSYFQLGVMGTCTAFAPNYASYCVFRFAGGMALSGFGLSIACLVVEWIPTPYRAVTVALTGFSYTLGQILLAGIAYAVPHWRWLQLTVSLPFFVFFLFSWWLAESARWLVLAGKEEKAVQILQRVAKINGREEEGKKITVEFLKSNMKEELAALKSSYTISDLVRTPVIRHIFFCLSIVWFSISFSYYGLAMDLQNFGVSIYLIQVIFGAVDFPAKLVVTVSVSYIGRRVSLMVALVLAGLVIIANIFVPSDLQTVRTTLAVIGKGCLSASFNCVFLFTTELYPTPIRQTGLGFGSTMARVGGIVAPLVKMMEEYYPFLPPAVYGVAPILAAVAAGFLPETLNRPLPDTIEEVENRAKHKKTPNPKEKIPLHPQDTAVQKEP